MNCSLVFVVFIPLHVNSFIVLTILASAQTKRYECELECKCQPSTPSSDHDHVMAEYPAMEYGIRGSSITISLTVLSHLCLSLPNRDRHGHQQSTLVSKAHLRTVTPISLPKCMRRPSFPIVSYRVRGCRRAILAATAATTMASIS